MRKVTATILAPLALAYLIVGLALVPTVIAVVTYWIAGPESSITALVVVGCFFWVVWRVAALRRLARKAARKSGSRKKARR